MGRSQREHELYQKWGDVKTSREMLTHLEEHKNSGDNVNYAMYSIKERNKNLDRRVEPYERKK